MVVKPLFNVFASISGVLILLRLLNCSQQDGSFRIDRLQSLMTEVSVASLAVQRSHGPICS